MYKLFIKINFVFTLVTTILLPAYLIGFLLAIPLGVFQVGLFLMYVFDKKVEHKVLNTHFIIYASLASLDLLGFLIGGDYILVLPCVGMCLAWYHVWFSKQLKRKLFPNE